MKSAKVDIVKNYLKYLQDGNIEKILTLFAVNAIVTSPIYGKIRAKEFYTKLINDTITSKIQLRKVFKEIDSGTIAVYFNYLWITVQNQRIEFDVIDIIEFNNTNEIVNLKIIYDAEKSRKKLNVYSVNNK